MTPQDRRASRAPGTYPRCAPSPPPATAGDRGATPIHARRSRMESDYYAHMEFDPEHQREVLRFYLPMFAEPADSSAEGKQGPVLEVGCGAARASRRRGWTSTRAWSSWRGPKATT